VMQKTERVRAFPIHGGSERVCGSAANRIAYDRPRYYRPLLSLSTSDSAEIHQTGVYTWMLSGVRDVLG
jgi:hypothetical protein